MKKLFLISLLLFGCTQKESDWSEQAKQEIIKVDIAMSDIASREGFYKTLLLYSEDSVVLPKEGEFPVIGKSALEKYWGGKDGTKDISWVPYKAEAAKSGEMGYTLGNWKFVTKDSTYYGNYCTIWKRQKNGNWKFVFDGGNGTPAPLK